MAAGAGLFDAKNGNRSVSSRSGSADVLRSLGVNIEAEASRVEECISEAGIGFLFAPMLHGAMKYAALLEEIGIRSIFNILGPLTNPASQEAGHRRLCPVADRRFSHPSTRRPTHSSSGEDGLDEITPQERRA